MPKPDPRVTAYIAGSAPFARPILRHLRRLVHVGCPEVTETIKWGFPTFECQGILCTFAAFKRHAVFGFWKGQLLFAKDRERQKSTSEAMGHFGRLTRVEELPSDQKLLAIIREARRLNVEGIQRPPRLRVGVRRQLQVPPVLQAALRQHPKAKATFYGFSYSHQKEYVEWIAGAKQEATRQRRLATALKWLSAGKTQNWRYERR